MSSSIKIAYTLNPPSSVSCSLDPEKTQDFPVSGNGETASAYYTNLRKTIEVARETIGAEMTQWRDAVGKAEDAKMKTVKKIDEEEDEVEEE